MSKHPQEPCRLSWVNTHNSLVACLELVTIYKYRMSWEDRPGANTHNNCRRYSKLHTDHTISTRGPVCLISHRSVPTVAENNRSLSIFIAREDESFQTCQSSSENQSLGDDLRRRWPVSHFKQVVINEVTRLLFHRHAHSGFRNSLPSCSRFPQPFLPGP